MRQYAAPAELAGISINTFPGSVLWLPLQAAEQSALQSLSIDVWVALLGSAEIYCAT